MKTFLNVLLIVAFTFTAVFPARIDAVQAADGRWAYLFEEVEPTSTPEESLTPDPVDETPAPEESPNPDPTELTPVSEESVPTETPEPESTAIHEPVASEEVSGDVADFFDRGLVLSADPPIIREDKPVTLEWRISDYDLLREYDPALKFTLPGGIQPAEGSNGSLHSKQLNKPWGEMRFSSGTFPTDYKYTGQREEAALGLYDYKARFYDPALGRFTQADSIVPDPFNPLDWDRYAYVRSSPLKYTDPDGHVPWLVLIGVMVFMATLPGDTGPYEVDPTTVAVGEAGLRMADPVHWVYTGVACYSGNCSGMDIIFGILPFVNGGIDNAADALRAFNSTDALAHADDVVEMAGQFHHIFSNKISNALDKHRTIP